MIKASTNDSDSMEDSLPSQSETQTSKRLDLTHDRLSELPDLALTRILSHLFCHEAAKPPSYRNVSTHSGITSPYSAFPTQIVAKIDKFSVKFRYDLLRKNSVDEWVNFALRKKVKCLCLNFVQKAVKNHVPFTIVKGIEYDLPDFVFDDGNLVELVTRRCRFSTDALINWNSLRKLSISRTKLSEGLISRVLCGCPVLETLELKEWSGFDKLKIDSGSLRVLRIIEEQVPNYVIEHHDNCLMEISGPNLVSLEVSGSLWRTKLRLSDVGCLINATMDFEIKPQAQLFGGDLKLSWLETRDQDIIREVLESLSFVKTLTVGGWCIKALSSCEAYNLSSPRSERRSLNLCISLIKWDNHGIASLLESSPYLETLAIKLSHCSNKLPCAVVHDSNSICDEYYWKSWSTISKCPVLHLKKVEVINFPESCELIKILFQFLQFLLRNSRFLEEIVIQASKHMTRETINEAMKLLAVSTASPDAVVLFEPAHFWVDTGLYDLYLRED
ncbi:hypothetical protein RDABS01_037473 [Bienertia sinuspersici]